ncbi:hypothetical protein A3C57_01515 [Candidatus Nomurabacteria bacterium RIFCSPHIGHO2_02_FULL_33_12]|uniref:Phosphatidic acid phosphatase type 2/haloperoxidase domain-containing protein n=1 Tax=Candidatus Nomurabacteria bacterium RIFCSPLOWO2_01_FULL_33_17 TaxID=1801764 RepID=A0A1F6WQY1_9BACT|nr:MAG: hypothetical protein A3C57_01515 [Candidatus Nomurabacteria bacterium RIFCSPHIGHO2_02_FULL_33_12]OGI84155.1 MAG: hypothetical protein A2903_01140 [Candidatus Nomurabacteria bacterium RIFCSPLOWO2_01_FULL_33_17]
MSNLFIFLYSFAWQWPVVDAIVIFLAKYFQYIVIGYACLLMYRELVSQSPELSPFRNIKRAITEGFWVTGSVVLAMGITYIIKYSLAIPRPFLSGVVPLFVHGGYNSFPSGHATFFASLALAMFFYHKKRGWYFLLSALIIGLARIISGVHYPIDIVAGYIIGIASAYFVIKLFRPWFKKIFLKL